MSLIDKRFEVRLSIYDNQTQQTTAIFLEHACETEAEAKEYCEWSQTATHHWPGSRQWFEKMIQEKDDEQSKPASR